MIRQSFGSNLGGTSGEPQIIVQETTLEEEEEERQRNESPPRCLDPDLPSLDPCLLSPWRDARKHSLPTPQCTSGITASQVRRLSERGAEAGPSPRQATFLSTLSQAPGPQPGGRRHSVNFCRMPPSMIGHNRRVSIAELPFGGAHNCIREERDKLGNIINPRKVCLKMYETSASKIAEVQSLEGNMRPQRYTQNQKRRFSEMPIPSVSPTSSLRRRSSELPKIMGASAAAGIVCSNTDLKSILSSLATSATEINRCGEEPSSSRDETKSSWTGKPAEQKRNRLKFRSNSFDVSIPHESSSNWFTRRHQQKSEDLITTLNRKFDKSKAVKTLKEILGRPSPTSSDVLHKVMWDDTSGTKVDAQVLGSAIEKILTAHKGSDAEASSSSGRTSVSPNKSRSSKVASWFSSGNKDQEQTEACEPSICSSLKNLFVK